MGNLNKVQLIGNLGKDPEVKDLQNGTQVCRFSLATNENWKDKEGKEQTRTEWHTVVVWGKLAGVCGKWLRKGRPVYVEGKLQTRKWQDKEGKDRYSTEIVAGAVQFLGAKEGGGGRPPLDDYGQAEGKASGHDFGPEPSFDTSDEIPF